RVRASQKGQLQRIGRLEIVDVSPLTGNQRRIFAPPDGRANQAFASRVSAMRLAQLRVPVGSTGPMTFFAIMLSRKIIRPGARRSPLSLVGQASWQARSP